jgi:hypothetical protein
MNRVHLFGIICFITFSVFCQILEQTDHPFEVGGSYCDFFLQNRYPSLDRGYSFWFRSFFCWNLCMDGMRTGLPRMSSSGW